MKVTKPIEVSYTYTDDVDTALDYFKDLDAARSPIALDFEAAIHYSPTQLAEYKEKLETETLSFYQALELKQALQATALSHPKHSFPTHLSIGITENTAKVIIITTYEMLHLVLDWLVTTELKQIWHNAPYDFKHIYYHTGSFPKNYEDTAQLAKSILNHVDTWKAKVGLKDLAGEWYGAWGISADHFNVDQIHDEKVLKYAATDGCATMKLWNSINKYLKDQDND